MHLTSVRNILKTKLKNEKKMLETKKAVSGLICDIYPCGSECCTVSPMMMRQLEVADILFYRMVLKIAWASRVSCK